MPWTNYHSHTYYCDGQSKLDAYIKEAIEQGLIAYGYSSHAPVPFFCEWTIPEDKLQGYINDASKIKTRYAEKIQVYCGLEIDYIPDVTGPADKKFQSASLDYNIGSIHFVDSFEDGQRWTIDYTFDHFTDGIKKIFRKDAKKAVKRFFALTREMLNISTPDIIGHLDKIRMYNANNMFFNENEAWYLNEIEETLKLIKKKDVIIEVNTRGFYRNNGYFFPGVELFEKIKSMDIPVTINSDAHKPNEIIKGYTDVAGFLKTAGIDELWILFDNKWKPFKYEIVKGISL